MPTTLPTSPVFDVFTFGGEYLAMCRSRGWASERSDREYSAVYDGSDHSHVPGIASIFSGVVR